MGNHAWFSIYQVISITRVPNYGFCLSILLQAKPEPNLSGAKRKAVTPPAVGASELPSVGSKKRPKEEWSCALCQVTATSERGLNEHLQGKRHKAKEAGLRAQKTGKNSSTVPKKIGKTTKPIETTGTPSSEQGVKLEKESFKVNKTEAASVQKTKNTGDLEKKKEVPPRQKKQKAGDSEKKNNEPPLQKKQDAEDSKKKNGEEVAQKVQKKVKKFKFWCELCQIGAYSEVVMTTHRSGKKHLARVQELSQNAGTVTAPIILPLPEDARKANDAEVVAKEANAEVVAKEANEKKKENVDAAADGPGSSSGGN